MLQEKDHKKLGQKSKNNQKLTYRRRAVNLSGRRAFRGRRPGCYPSGRR